MSSSSCPLYLGAYYKFCRSECIPVMFSNHLLIAAPTSVRIQLSHHLWLPEHDPQAYPPSALEIYLDIPLNEIFLLYLDMQSKWHNAKFSSQLASLSCQLKLNGSFLVLFSSREFNQVTWIHDTAESDWSGGEWSGWCHHCPVLCHWKLASPEVLTMGHFSFLGFTFLMVPRITLCKIIFISNHISRNLARWK